MAIFIPSLEQIKQSRVKPTEGEMALLLALRQLDDTFEVFFSLFVMDIFRI